MQLHVGTSGFSYKAWKGSFYPEKHPDREMLAYYATKLPAVEINNTFYRTPRRELLEGWAAKVGPDFRFVLKAPQRITHRARLAEAKALVAELWDAAVVLKDRLGPILFQLPPSFRRNDERLETFLDELPDGLQPAFEFRHASWEDEQVHALLRAKGATLCHADVDGGPRRAPVATCGIGYLRLRRTDYTAEDLEFWAQAIVAQPWEHAFVFFKHEDAGAAPRFARELGELVNR